MKLLTTFLITLVTSTLAFEIFRDFCPQRLERDDGEFIVENYNEVFERIALFETQNNITISSKETLELPEEIVFNTVNYTPIEYELIVGFAQRGKSRSSKTKREDFYQCFRCYYESDEEIGNLPVIIIDESSSTSNQLLTPLLLIGLLLIAFY